MDIGLSPASTCPRRRRGAGLLPHPVHRGPAAARRLGPRIAERPGTSLASTTTVPGSPTASATLATFADGRDGDGAFDTITKHDLAIGTAQDARLRPSGTSPARPCSRPIPTARSRTTAGCCPTSGCRHRLDRPRRSSTPATSPPIPSPGCTSPPCALRLPRLHGSPRSPDSGPETVDDRVDDRLDEGGLVVASRPGRRRRSRPVHRGPDRQADEDRHQ